MCPEKNQSVVGGAQGDGFTWEGFPEDSSRKVSGSPERLLERLEELRGDARLAAGSRRVELYARSAIRLRVRAEGSGPAIVETGRDEGLAVRVADGSGRVGFAASSGIDREALDLALDEATRSAGPAIAEPWATGGDAALKDHDEPTPLPGEEELKAWLAPHGLLSWVECGRTVEALVADGGLRATRLRNRAWAMCLVPVATGDGIEDRPRLVAARRLADLPADLFAIGDLPEGSPVDFDRAARDLPVILAPHVASVLVRPLIRVLCGATGGGPLPVGPAFVVTEDPLHPEGLSGGRFDDAGFVTRKRILADGRSASAADRGPGDYLRESYRDPPRLAFGPLAVARGTDAAPSRGVRVEHLRIHAVDADHWVLEAGGVVEEEGTATRPVRPAFVRVRPSELALRIHGAVGDARLSANGVIAPTLLLDGRLGE